MSEKDPQTWMQMWDAIPDTVKAAMLSVIVAFVRILYDGQEPRVIRRLLEASLCGLITLSVVGIAVEVTGLDSTYVMAFIGGFVGLFGADYVRSLGRRFAAREIERERKRDATDT